MSFSKSVIMTTIIGNTYSTYYVPGTLLSASHILIYLILSLIPETSTIIIPTLEMSKLKYCFNNFHKSYGCCLAVWLKSELQGPLLSWGWSDFLPHFPLFSPGIKRFITRRDRPPKNGCAPFARGNGGVITVHSQSKWQQENKKSDSVQKGCCHVF